MNDRIPVMEVSCFHCGHPVTSKDARPDERVFCCQGCQTVYELLATHSLCEYYSFDPHPGKSQPLPAGEDTYRCLDIPEVQASFLTFKSASMARASFTLPAIHCVSCIWLLENLQRLNQGILRSVVVFGKKQVTIDYRPDQVSLSDIGQLLHQIGYPPQMQMSDREKRPQPQNRRLIIQLAVAGFAFGNVMLLSFPEYLGLDGASPLLQRWFSWLNVLLAVPVLIYSARDYFLAAGRSFWQQQIHIELPIAVGLAALFFRSVFDIGMQTGPGYMDSFTGLVFFLLVGRWFQNKTYDALAFDRDYKSYFPLAVQRWTSTGWQPVVVYEVVPDDRIRIRNMEIIPADGVLLTKEALIDYSFVTGEARPVTVRQSQAVYAGGRLVGEPVELLVTRRTEQSYLTSLWNHATFQKSRESRYRLMIDRAAQRFTWGILILTFLTAAYWFWADASRVWLIVTSVLVVACPCALALAAPFTYGNMLRIFGLRGLYLKNADVVEQLAGTQAVVFDKTGTVTHGAAEIDFVGIAEPHELAAVRQLAEASSHPLSRLLVTVLPSAETQMTDFREFAGRGLEALIGGQHIRLGQAAWVGHTGMLDEEATQVFLSVEGEVRGYFRVRTQVRSGMRELMQRLGSRVVALLSGDHASSAPSMIRVLGDVPMYFGQSPHDKLAFVEALQHGGSRVLMVGDGLNDSGALRQADVGIAVSDDTSVFTPACDGILEGGELHRLDDFLALSCQATFILKVAFGISLFYNAMALSFAVSGSLTPLVAAILMPISSVSVVGFSTLAVRWAAQRQFSKR